MRKQFLEAEHSGSNGDNARQLVKLRPAPPKLTSAARVANGLA